MEKYVVDVYVVNELRTAELKLEIITQAMSALIKSKDFKVNGAVMDICTGYITGAEYDLKCRQRDYEEEVERCNKANAELVEEN